MDTYFQDLQVSLCQSWELNYPFFYPQLLTVPVQPLDGVICGRKAVPHKHVLCFFPVKVYISLFPFPTYFFIPLLLSWKKNEENSI